MRSTAILKGTENEYYRATYKSMGFSSDDMKDRPLIGIANAWSECVPGHYNLRQVAEKVKAGVSRGEAAAALTTDEHFREWTASLRKALDAAVSSASAQG